MTAEIVFLIIREIKKMNKAATLKEFHLRKSCMDSKGEITYGGKKMRKTHTRGEITQI